MVRFIIYRISLLLFNFDKDCHPMLNETFLKSPNSAQYLQISETQLNQPEEITKILMQELESQKYYYFLFVNSKSGDKVGLKYLTLANKTVVFKYPDQHKVSFVEIFDMFDELAVSQGMKKAKQSSQRSQMYPLTKTRIIICGGDGTIQWVLSSALKAGINLDFTPVGILPIGTGNDFSRSMGWGYKTIQFTLKKIHKLYKTVKMWNNAEQDYYDMWDCQINVFGKQGCFYDIKNQQQRKIQDRVFKKSFTNYIGIGLDARIVYSVQRNRGRNAFFTKILYTVVGIVNYFRYLRPIDEYITGFHQLNCDDQITQSNQSEQLEQSCISTSSNRQKFKQSPETEQQSKMNESLQIYHRSHSIQKNNLFEGQKSIDDQFEIVKGYKGLVCLNCTSYMSGIRGIWHTKQQQASSSARSYQPQQPNDGLIQFMAFKNQLSLALQRITRNGVKISQGKGPYLINFKQPQLQTQEETFMQIDGQSLKVINIQSIKITKSKKYDGSRIRVIKRKGP